MDGTLTQPVHDFERIRAELGIPSGVFILEALEEMPSDQARQARQRLEQLEYELAREAVAQQGVEELLHRLRSQNRNLGILTRNGEAIAKATLEACGLRQFFDDDVIIGRETCSPKPDAAGVNHLLSHWNSAPGRTVIVGDYVLDLEAGRNAGINTVHFDHTAGFAWPHLTDIKISAIVELHDYF